LGFSSYWTPTGRDDSSIGKRSAFSDVRLNCLASADLLRGDRVLIDGTTYDVTFVAPSHGSSSATHHKQARIEAHT
jgi:hypothetical protein